MPAQWTGELIGKMHTMKIKHKDLALKLGYHEKYVSQVLNGHTEPKGAEQRFNQALNELVQEKPPAVDSQATVL